MKRVLLTGATGFLGSYVSRLLVDKYQVIAIHRKSSNFDLVKDIKSKIEWIECDLEDILLLEEVFPTIDMIIHCAAVVSFLSEDEQLMQRINVEATRELVDLSVAYGIERFVHISSIAALGRQKDGEKIDEQVEWKAGPLNNAYGISKQMAERELWRGSAEGLDMVILNPSLIIGAGHWAKGSPALARQVEKGNAFYPIGSTGFVDVRDVAEVSIKALESPESNLRVIVSAENGTYKEFLTELAIKFGSKQPTVALNKSLIALAWRGDMIASMLLRRKRLISKASLMAASHKSVYDNALSRELFSHNYRALRTTLHDLSQAYTNSKKTGCNYGIMPFL